MACKQCKGYNDSLSGDYCIMCIRAAWRDVDNQPGLKVTLEPKVTLEVQAQHIMDKLNGVLHKWALLNGATYNECIHTLYKEGSGGNSDTYVYIWNLINIEN